jgi:hypothetical protein
MMAISARHSRSALAVELANALAASAYEAFSSPPLVVVGKGFKLTRNRSVGHGLGSAKQSPCCF